MIQKMKAASFAGGSGKERCLKESVYGRSAASWVALVDYGPGCFVYDGYGWQPTSLGVLIR